jgi:hypothetical protein
MSTLGTKGAAGERGRTRRGEGAAEGRGAYGGEKGRKRVGVIESLGNYRGVDSTL